MTPRQIKGFISGYQNKEAFWPFTSKVTDKVVETAAAAGKGLGKRLYTLLLAIPIVTGGVAGLVHSTMTSPSKMDLAGSQKALELTELEEFATELKRRREAATRQGKKEKSDARALRL
jgi:3-deoxy-D-manno-octulosonic acid (KDO) 8-phosphate synthase